MYNCAKLKDFSSQIMQAAGLSAEDSRLFAESLVEADMRGVSSHGVTRLTAYSRRVNEKLVNTDGDISILSDGGALLKIDGNNNMGVVTASKTMKLCIERAREYGVCFAAVKGGGHFGAASFYTQMAAAENMIGICTSNGPVAVAPIGGKEPFLGTNPLSIAVPAGKYRPLVLDMATSIVARGKITLAQKKGTQIPLGWGVDKDGKPTEDPNKVLDGGAVLPFGGAKGYAISMIIDLLCSCLADGKNSRNVGGFYDFSGTTQDLGFFMGVINVAKVMPAAEFDRKVDAAFDELKAQPKGDGVSEIMVPGEIEFNNYRAAEKNGIELSPAVVAELVALSQKYNIPFDCEM